ILHSPQQLEHCMGKCVPLWTRLWNHPLRVHCRVQLGGLHPPRREGKTQGQEGRKEKRWKEEAREEEGWQEKERAETLMPHERTAVAGTLTPWRNTTVSPL